MTRLNALALAFAVPATAGLTLAAPLAAQSRGAAGVVDLERISQGSTAARDALALIQTTYATNIQQAQQADQTANVQIQPLVASGQAEQAKPQPNQAQLQTLRTQIDQIRSRTQAQIQQLLQPAQIAQAYVSDEINDAVLAAVASVGRTRKVSMVVRSDTALYFDPSNDLTNEVLAELNRTTPQVGITPPAEWLQQRGIGAAAQPGAAPAPAPTPQPQGR